MNLDQLKNDAHDKLAKIKEAEAEDKRPVSMDSALTTIKGWKQFYLKRNQVKNYLRITRVIPPREQNPAFWRHRLQLLIILRHIHEQNIKR
jgi:hypothetical protein